jgi:hypothetical protein
MAEKMTIEKMSVEMDILWSRIKELEMGLSQKLENTLKNTTRKLKRQLSADDAGLGSMVISNKIRGDLIQLTAYHKAENRGFSGGDPEQDWLEAEQEVDRLLLGGQLTLDDAAELSAESIGSGKIVLPRKPRIRPERQKL